MASRVSAWRNRKRGPGSAASTDSSWASTARWRRSTTVASSWPLMSASRRQSKLRPSSAAATRRSRVPGDAPRRRRTVSANVAGMATPWRAVEDPAVGCLRTTRRPGPSLPAAPRRETAVHRPSPLPPRQARGGRPEPAGSPQPSTRPLRRSGSEAPRWLRSAGQRGRGRTTRPCWVRSLRSETKQRTGSPAMLSARYSTTSIVSASAHCRSSSTSTQPAPPPRAASSLSTASPSDHERLLPG